MTGRSHRIHTHQQGVVVAVNLHFHKVEEVTAGLSLRPQGIAGTTPEGDVLGSESLLISFFVHESQHQHVLRRGVLYDGRHQASHLLKIYLHRFI